MVLKSLMKTSHLGMELQRVNGVRSNKLIRVYQNHPGLLMDTQASWDEKPKGGSSARQQQLTAGTVSS